ncbi:MAG: OsmC family protein [Deltaproteobacteria bacterium]|nr:OsmC family protein [Deltaproteobacteria bacterium]
MRMEISFPGGKKVDAHFGGHVVRTDQPASNGGEDSAPAPYMVFLASIGTCAGIYVAGFCQNRGLPTEGIRVIQDNDFNAETGRLDAVRLHIEVPEDFPEKYHEALVRVAQKCAVKRTLMDAPTFDVVTEVRLGAA